MRIEMQKVRFYIVVVVGVIALSITAFTLGPASRGQSPKPKPESPVTPTVLKTDRNSVATASFAAAAERNASLRNELIWTFGGKQQRGWYLYDELIQRTLNTNGESTSSEFAAALAAWQKRTGLSVDGVLDEDTLMAMVSQWQSDRLKNRTPAETDQLMTPSPSEFYDPERLAELRQIERETYAAYKKMLAAAIADPTLKLNATTNGELAPTEKYFKVISAFRSREYQEQLRRKSPNAGSAGLAVNSPHFTGRALDLYVGGDPVDTKDANRAIQVKTPAYQWLVRNAERFGFRPYFYEPWHWEYVR
jgi:LAS superfamily LD-carboxypeptidase LdcB